MRVSASQPHTALNLGSNPSPNVPATLHLLCGKIGSGKSTLARQLASETGAILISEDEWLASLYPGEIHELADYVRCAGRLKTMMANHIHALLTLGVPVVLDFPSNTLSSRQWARDVFEKASAPHRLHYLDVPDDVCKARLRARNASGEHPFETTDEQFEQISRYFVVPSESEGFEVVLHAAS